MNARIVLLVTLLFWGGCGPTVADMNTSPVGCAELEPETPLVVPETHTFVFDQEEATRSLPPNLETDVTLPTGTEDWRLSVSCRNHGFVCRRASVSVTLTFERPTAPDVRIVLTPAGEPAQAPEPSTCFEDWVNDAPPHSRCTVIVNEGWEDPDAGGGRRDFMARVENAGPTTVVHVTVSVIDPLE